MKRITLTTVFTVCFLTIINSQIITTIAGIGIRGYYGDGGEATNAKLYGPSQICLDKAGNVYVADYNNNVIRKITIATGIITTIAGNGYDAGMNRGAYSGDGGQATAAELNQPASVATDTVNNIYIADYMNNRVRKVTVSTGIITTIAGDSTAGFSGDGGQATAAELNQPTGIIVDKFGNTYIADGSNFRIRKISISTGIINTMAGDGTIAYSGDGNQATAAGCDPFGLSLDDSNNLYLADFMNNRIRKIALSTGIINTVVGTGISGYSGDGGQATAAELNKPIDVKTDVSGNIYIADWSNNRIRKINKSTGIITTLAGNGISGYSGDGGQATAAEMQTPDGLAIDSSDDVYIADGHYSVIRKILNSPSGIDELINGDRVNLYPNPNNGEFTVQIGDNYQSIVKRYFEIYNMIGEKIYSLKFVNSTSEFKIDLNEQSTGIYLYRVITENDAIISQGKFIIQK